jgi:small conductance mechanosensitive channel
MIRLVVSALAILSAALASPAARGEPAAQPAAPPPVPVTTAPAEAAEKPAALISTAELDLRLLPMRKADLGKEVDAWMNALQSKVQAISETEIAVKSAEGEAKTTLLERLGQLQTDRTSLLDRVNLVLAAFRTKGGDTAEQDKYITAVSGIKVDVTDAHAASSVVLNWLKSPEGGLRWARNIALFVVVLIVARVVGGVVSSILSRALRAVKTMSDLLRDFFVNTARQLITLIGVVVALSMLGVDIGPMIAAIGAVGFIVGFALQGTLGNFAAGLMILLYRPYDVGDEIAVGGIKGQVESMTLVSTSLVNAENQRIIAPNNAIWGGVITNLSKGSVRKPA